MLGALVTFMIANPATSHALTAVLETAGVAAALILLRSPRPEGTAALLVSTYYYGREAGQREHDIKHAGWDAVQAHLGAEFLYGWSVPNVQQWLAPTAAAWAVAAALVLIRAWRARPAGPGRS
jgi:hypothetical protein